MQPKIPLHDPRFVYIPSANHDADSTKFRDRQMKRIAEANAARQRAAESNVKPIKKGSK